jgi:hypothetical protein
MHLSCTQYNLYNTQVSIKYLIIRYIKALTFVSSEWRKYEGIFIILHEKLR